MELARPLVPLVLATAARAKVQVLQEVLAEALADNRTIEVPALSSEQVLAARLAQEVPLELPTLC